MIWDSYFVASPNAAYQPRRALRAVGWMRWFGDRFGSTRYFIASTDG
jgi:hypothetical protein